MSTRNSRNFFLLSMLFGCCLFVTEFVYGQQPIGMPSPYINRTPVDALSENWQAHGPINWEIAATLGLLSKTAYEDDLELMNLLAKGMGFDECQSFVKANSSAHALISDKVVVIAFRGTEFNSLADWKTDAFIRFLPPNPAVGGGRLHTGFHNAYEDVRGDVETVFRASAGKKVWLTGHSLGGAMAVFCGIRSKSKNLVETRLVTFGQPRVGDNRAAQWIDAQFSNTYQRFVNDNDLVPRLPPNNWYFQYADAGRYIQLGRNQLMATAMSPDDGESGETNRVLTVIPFNTVGANPMTYQGQLDENGVRELQTIYQSPQAILPVTDRELNDLIAQEAGIRAQTTRQRLFFPESTAGDLQSIQPYRTVAPLDGQPMLAGGWFDVEYISDHYMNGYLKLLRDQRDGIKR